MKTALVLLVGALLGSIISSAYRIQAVKRERDAVRGELARVRLEVGSACEPVYAALWVEHKCSGVAGWAIPGALAPLACPQTIGVWRGSREADAWARVQERGPAATVLVLEERGARERALPVLWQARRR